MQKQLFSLHFSACCFVLLDAMHRRKWMAARLGFYRAAAFGGDDLLQLGTVIMQYIGHSDYTENDSPIIVCVGKNDSIANWRSTEQRIETLDSLGIPTEFRHYPGLRHSFGLGIGTVAEGWINEAVAFWQAQT